MGPHSVVKPNSVLGIHLVFGSNLSQDQCVVVGPISKGPYFVVEIIVLCGPQGRIFFNKGVLMILFRPFLMHIYLMGPPTHFLICYQPLIINFNIYMLLGGRSHTHYLTIVNTDSQYFCKPTQLQINTGMWGAPLCGGPQARA